MITPAAYSNIQLELVITRNNRQELVITPAYSKNLQELVITPAYSNKQQELVITPAYGNN